MADESTSLESTPETEEKFECTIKVEDSGVWKKKVTIEVPRSQIDKVLEDQYGQLMDSAEVPGFRKGRAPRRIVEKRFGEEINKQVKLNLLSQAFEKFDSEYEFDILGEPDLDIDKIEVPETGDMSFDYEIEVTPVFEVPELEGVRIEKPLYEVTEEQIDETLDNLRRRQGRMEEVESGAEEDDYVRADVTLKIEGRDDETREDQLVRVGSTALMGVVVDDMGKTLKGAEAGKTYTCTADMDENHPREEFRNKQAHFTIEVRGVRRLIPAELNEEFLAQTGCSDEAELRQRIEENLESEADREIRNMMSRQVTDYLNEKITFDLPEGVAARHAARVLQRQYYDLMRRGVPAEQISENIETLRAQSSEESARQLKMSFIMDKVAEKLEITVGDAEINGFIAQMAAMYQRRPEKLRDEMQREGRLDEMHNMIRDEKALDKILEMAEVVDAPAEDSSSAEKPKRTPPAKSDNADA